MVLDECLAYPATPDAAAASMERSARWAQRCRTRLLELRGSPGEGTVTNPGQAQFGIVQGGVFQPRRDESVDRTVDIGFEGYAIGGLSVGEPIDVMYQIASDTARRLPEAQPRYLMGAGTPDDLVECVARGIDMFDCVMPTRNARNGQLFTSEGQAQHPQRPLRRGRAAPRSGLSLLHLPPSFPGLSAASLYGR